MSQTNNQNDLLLKAKRAIMFKNPVTYNGNTYTPEAIIWKYLKVEFYSVRLIDTTAQNSSVEALLTDIIF